MDICWEKFFQEIARANLCNKFRDRDKNFVMECLDSRLGGTILFKCNPGFMGNLLDISI